MIPGRSAVKFFAVLLFIHQAVGSQRSKMLMSIYPNGADPVCLTKDDVECTCTDLQSQIMTCEEVQDQDPSNQFLDRSSRSSSSSSSSGSSRRSKDDVKCFHIDGNSNNCIHMICCQDGQLQGLLVFQNCRKCVPTVTTEAITTMLRTTTIIINDPTVSEASTTEATTTEATTTEAVTTEATTTEAVTTNATTTEAMTTEATTTEATTTEATTTEEVTTTEATTTEATTTEATTTEIVTTTEEPLIIENAEGVENFHPSGMVVDGMSQSQGSSDEDSDDRSSSENNSNMVTIIEAITTEATELTTTEAPTTMEEVSPTSEEATSTEATTTEATTTEATTSTEATTTEATTTESVTRAEVDPTSEAATTTENEITTSNEALTTEDKLTTSNEATTTEGLMIDVTTTKEPISEEQTTTEATTTEATTTEATTTEATTTEATTTEATTTEAATTQEVTFTLELDNIEAMGELKPMKRGVLDIFNAEGSTLVETDDGSGDSTKSESSYSESNTRIGRSSSNSRSKSNSGMISPDGSGDNSGMSVSKDVNREERSSSSESSEEKSETSQGSETSETESSASGMSVSEDVNREQHSGSSSESSEEKSETSQSSETSETESSASGMSVSEDVNREQHSGSSSESSKERSETTESSETSDTESSASGMSVSEDVNREQHSGSSSESSEEKSETSQSSETSDTESSASVNQTDCNNESSDSLQCPTVTELLAGTCTESCIVEDVDGCPSCDCTCLDLRAQDPPKTASPCNCMDNQMCLRVGRFGKHKCVDLLSEGERCDGGSGPAVTVDNDNSGDNSGEGTSKSISGSSSSRTGRRGRNNRLYAKLNATVGCQDGLVCTPVSADKSECLPENPEGPCTAANQEFVCAPDGTFEPLQCQPALEGLLGCVCVRPSDGSLVMGTEVIVTSKDDAPDCALLVGCTFVRGGQNVTAPHGDFFVDIDGCRRCLCNDRKATLCEPIPCIISSSQVAQTGCVYEKKTYRDGEQFEVDCNLCACSNGNIYCTGMPCAELKARDECQECKNEPLNQFCGINGVTYPSACAAAYCGGLSPNDYLPGDCSSLDVCSMFPCEEGEKCIPLRGTTCFDADGCDPADVRLCVNLESLLCEDQTVSKQNGQDQRTVCGTNGVTYPDLCRLLQDTGNEAVAYAGECDREECQGGPVCGSDGVTHDNVCILRTRSANVRVDYPGECEQGSEISRENLCVRVSQSGRCARNTSNCDNLVRPEGGCCPICGGIIFIAIDFASLRDYIRINPGVRNLDGLIEDLVDSRFIGNKLTGRCELEVTFTTTNNIQIALSAKTEKDAEFCNDATKSLAAAINDPSSPSQSLRIPEVLHFARAAVLAPTTADEPNKLTEIAMQGISGSVQATMSFLTALLLATIVFVLY